MIKTYVILSLFMFSTYSFSQDQQCDCLHELEEVSILIKKAKSYQIKKTNKEADLAIWKKKI